MNDNVQSDAQPRDLIIVGAGGFAPEAVWVAEDINTAATSAGRPVVWNILGYVVYDPSKFPAEISSYPVVGTPEQFAKTGKGRPISFICMIGSNAIREQEAKRAEALGWTPVALVHPSAIVARGSRIGPGTYVGAGSIIAPLAVLGSYVVINNHVSVGHDSTMEDFSQASPGARINGACFVGRRAFLGSNATLLPKARVGEDAVVGASSLVLRGVAPRTTVVGVPARQVGDSAASKGEV